MSTQLNSAGTVNEHNRKNAQDKASATPDGFKIYIHIVYIRGKEFWLRVKEKKNLALFSVGTPEAAGSEILSATPSLSCLLVIGEAHSAIPSGHFIFFAFAFFLDTSVA